MRRSIRQRARDLLVGGLSLAWYVVASPLLRRRYNRRGATDAEVLMEMPGDELVPSPMLGSTRAISIPATPEEVWPWLVQIGQGRGGLYSFDTLENLVGCNIHSAETILPEHQNLRIGDVVRSGPDDYPCWVVTHIESLQHLVLIGAGTPAEVKVPDIVDKIPARGFAASTWQWMLRPEAGGTRLVVRQRLTCSRDQKRIWRFVEPIHYVMEHEMLRGLALRAEQAAWCG